MKNKDWFCKCCKNYYKRESATFLKEGSDDTICYQITGMCLKCYKEGNDGNEFGKSIEIVREELESKI